ASRWRASRAGFHRRGAARGRRHALHRGGAGCRPQGVRDARQPRRLAHGSCALPPSAAGGGAAAGHYHAERGVPLTFKNVEFFTQARPILERSPEAQRLYWPNGGPRAGAVVAYKDLAATLRQVAEGGLEVFYRGPIAATIARAVQEAGGWLAE